MKMGRGCVGLALLTGLLTWSPAARAEPPASANVIQLGLGFRYGFDLEEGDMNPWATGLGIDVGYTLPNAVYLGGSFEYFFGTSLEFPGGSSEGNILQLFAEAGYDLGLGGGAVVRPKAGVGFGSFVLETCIETNTGFGTTRTCEDGSKAGLALAPGLTLLFLEKNFSFSIDVRYEILLVEDEPLNGVLLALGFGF